MEMALNMGAFEALDRSELLAVDGGKFSTGCTAVGSVAVIASHFAPVPYSTALSAAGSVVILVGSVAASLGY